MQISKKVKTRAEPAPATLSDLKTQLEAIQAQIAKLESGA